MGPAPADVSSKPYRSSRGLGPRSSLNYDLDCGPEETDSSWSFNTAVPEMCVLLNQLFFCLKPPFCDIPNLEIGQSILVKTPSTF